jgi:hypothetical protein
MASLGLEVKNSDHYTKLSDLTDEQVKSLVAAIIIKRQKEENPEDIFGNIYTFTSNLEEASIVIEASNIVLDGADFAIGEIYKINGDNVEIKNLKIDSPATAIEIYGSNCK